MSKGTVTVQYLLAASQRQGSILHHLQKILLIPRCSFKKKYKNEAQHKESNEGFHYG